MWKQSLFLLAVVAAVSTCLIMAVVGADPGVYPNWPACKTSTEYVEIIAKSELVDGAVYNERKKGRNTKYYLCQPCTRCLSGIVVLAPCSVRADTKCSRMKCAMDGCIVDDFGCRLPGDPNEFPNIDAMMDPCDPAKSKVTTAAWPSDLSMPLLDHEVPNSSSDERPPIFEKPVENKQEIRAVTSEEPARVQTYVFWGLLFFLFMLIIGLFCLVCWKFRQLRSRDNVTHKTDRIEMRNGPNAVQATTQV
ncbi:uncharacterized protein LOC117305174 [Asterias rubens]|uniref:uncharacterized protein LOC117305174 n=1 Tax=Asterias rubens TaxID=7604 RepID=UPI001455C81D|nr:uncharacterized protein LOC117305174 [Asterias rubens]XP_033645869.1 uncharacterized protein LOC117305174 [Asterias rubens]